MPAIEYPPNLIKKRSPPTQGREQLAVPPCFLPKGRHSARCISCDRDRPVRMVTGSSPGSLTGPRAGVRFAAPEGFSTHRPASAFTVPEVAANAGWVYSFPSSLFVGLIMPQVGQKFNSCKKKPDGFKFKPVRFLKKINVSFFR